MSSERAFDRQLTLVIEEFNAVLNIGYDTRPEGAARDALIERASVVATSLEALTPPSAEWGELTGDYAQLMRIHLRHFGDVLPEIAQREFAEINDRATVRRETLREAHRSKPG